MPQRTNAPGSGRRRADSYDDRKPTGAQSTLPSAEDPFLQEPTCCPASTSRLKQEGPSK